MTLSLSTESREGISALMAFVLKAAAMRLTLLSLTSVTGMELEKRVQAMSPRLTFLQGLDRNNSGDCIRHVEIHRGILI